jgi:hypothetical protein
MQPITGWQECQSSLTSILTSQEPALIGRIGGSDTDALAALIEGAFTSPDQARQAALSHLPRVRQYNGYYDRQHSEHTYLRFLALLHASYLATPYLSFVDNKLLILYFSENINPVFRLAQVPYERAFRDLVRQIDAAQGDWQAFPYTFFQTLTGQLNLLRVFEHALRGKRVLVASPFGASIKANWPNRAGFFKHYDYPDMDLSILNVPITYEGLPDSMYPHANWFETLEALKAGLDSAAFDILLLSCGSYAMPLGLHARDALGRKAIYVGGILQLFFGIMGRRYENPFFLDAINPSAFIAPVEREKFLAHVAVGKDSPQEAFGAYF